MTLRSFGNDPSLQRLTPVIKTAAASERSMIPICAAVRRPAYPADPVSSASYPAALTAAVACRMSDSDTTTELPPVSNSALGPRLYFYNESGGSLVSESTTRWTGPGNGAYLSNYEITADGT